MQQGSSLDSERELLNVLASVNSLLCICSHCWWLRKLWRLQSCGSAAMATLPLDEKKIYIYFTSIAKRQISNLKKKKKRQTYIFHNIFLQVFHCFLLQCSLSKSAMEQVYDMHLKHLNYESNKHRLSILLLIIDACY